MSTSSNKGIGSVDTPSIALSNVYYIPSHTMNLAPEVVGTRHREGDLYVLDHFRDIHDTTSSSVDLSSFWLNRSSLPFYLWHSRLGHVSGSSLRFLASTGALEKLDANDISYCSVCKLAKLSALPFGNSVSSSNSPFDLVHSDVWGPSPVYTKGGSRYYVLFIEDFTRYTWVYLMKRMFNFLTILKEFRALVKTQHSTVIKCFRNDLGREYTSNEFFARSFLLAADVPNVFWGEAVLTAAYVINRIPTAHNSGLSLFEKLYGILPDYSSFSFDSFIASVHSLHKFVSYTKAVCDPLWQGDMVEELTALHQAHAWDLVPLPAGKHVIGSRWV
ncbi:gag-pol polyprotein [Tanacetum coccineum]